MVGLLNAEQQQSGNGPVWPEPRNEERGDSPLCPFHDEIGDKEMSSLYKMFEVDKAQEAKGVLLNMGDNRFLIARAGGGNKQFVECFKEKAKPFKFAIEHSKMEEEDSVKLMASVYAETVILGWESAVRDEEHNLVLTAGGKPKIQKSVEGKDGKQMKYSVENCTQLLIDLPELFREIQAFAGEYTTFLKHDEAADLGNLSES